MEASHSKVPKEISHCQLLLNALPSYFPQSQIEDLAWGFANCCNETLNTPSRWHIPLSSGTPACKCCWVSADCPHLVHYAASMLTPCMSSGPSVLRVQARGTRPAPLPTHRWVVSERPSGPYQHRSPVPVFNRVDRKAKQRPAESSGQGKHGNISFLLTQESGTDLREVACSFRCEPSAIRFNSVKTQVCGS